MLRACAQVCPTGWWRLQNLRVQPGSMPSRCLRRQKVADPKLPFEGRGACRCPFEPMGNGGNGGNAHIQDDEEEERSENGAKRLLPQTDKHVQNEPNRRITGRTPSSHLCIRFGKEQTASVCRLATKDAMASGRSAIRAEAAYGPRRTLRNTRNAMEDEGGQAVFLETEPDVRIPVSGACAERRPEKTRGQ